MWFSGFCDLAHRYAQSLKSPRDQVRAGGLFDWLALIYELVRQLKCHGSIDLLRYSTS